MVLRNLAAAWALAGITGLAGADEASRIRGTAADEAGQVLPGVTVGVHAQAAPSLTLHTDAQGRFEAAGLPAGRYQVDFRLPGFATSVREVTLQGGATAEVRATLRLALNTDVLVTSPRTFRNLTDLDEPVDGLLGLASAGSEGVVSAREIAQRPIYRSGEVYESVPGLVVSQHSGEGKANQYYVRGFTSTTAPTSRPPSRACPSTCPPTRTARDTRTTTS